MLLGSAFVIGVEVVIRKVFSLSMGGANELSTFGLAIASAWAFSFTLLERAHVRIESLYEILPPRLCAILDLLAHTVLTGVVAIVTWYGFQVFQNSVNMGSRTLSPLALPVAIPQFFWLAGLIYFLLVAALLLLRAAVALVTGDVATVQRVIGPRGIARELEQELEQVRERRAGAEGGER